MHTPNQYADLYLRLSLDREGKTAIERQEKDCRDWADQDGLKVRKVHVDVGRSGYRPGVERKGLDAALAALTSGVVGTLVVWKLDRLSRQGFAQVGLTLDKIEASGGRLVSVKDNLDSTDVSARLLIATLSELARSESDNLSLRVRSAKAFLRRRGRWIGGQPPFGYVNRDGRLYVDQETGPIVRAMAGRVLEGESLTEVTRWLNDEGVPSPRGGRWQVGSVAQLLRGPATAGLMPEAVRKADGSGYTGRVKPWINPDTMEPVSVLGEGQEPLITPSQQARIVAACRERTVLGPWGRRSGQPQPESKYLLTGLLRCAGCGERMSMSGRSYSCQSVRSGRSCATPGSGYGPALDDAVTAAWIGRLSTAPPNDPLLKVVAARWVSQRHPDAMAKRESVLEALNQETAALARLDEDHYVQRTLDRERYLPLVEGLFRRIEQLQETLAANPLPEAEISPLLDPISASEVWKAADVSARRNLLKLTLQEVRVTQGVRGRRFDPQSRLTFVWATAPPGSIGAGSQAGPQA